jgi:cytochrome c oxidase subunit II
MPNHPTIAGRTVRTRAARHTATRVLALATGISAAAGILFAGTTQGQSTLEPAGPRSAWIADLWWVMFWMGLAVFAIVLAVLAFAILRGRREETPADGGWFGSNAFVTVGGIIIPFVILMVVFGVTLKTLGAIASSGERDTLTIEVVGHQFWWEIRYPDHDVVTANEIHIPAGSRVELKLTADDVIHSLWVPELSGKTDLIPGRINTMWIEADRPGEYRGLCAEFCGIQHALMAFLVIAQPPEEFAGWLNAQREESREPVAGSLVERGEQIFLGSACVYCHTVRGTNASGMLGPDLTHIASRRTLGAGILENNVGNLAAWIIDPQSIKPGNRMPAANIDAEDLQALLAYLMTLD